MNNNTEITNDTELNNEPTDTAQKELSIEEIMWMARKQKNRKLYNLARQKLGLGKHWLQKKTLGKAMQWGRN